MTRPIAYTFDAAMTLFEVTPSVGAVYARVAQEFGVTASPEVLEAGFLQAWGERKPTDAHTSEEEEWEWWHGTVRRSFEIAGSLEALGDSFDPYFEAVYRRFDDAAVWRIYDDVLPALERLRAAGCRLAVVSNFDSRLHTVLGNLGLRPWFDAVIISAAAGVRKPDPAIFQQACAALGVPPGAACHIGDSIEEDYAGAIAAGLQARLLVRRGALPPHAASIEGLDALPLAVTG